MKSELLEILSLGGESLLELGPVGASFCGKLDG